jgi:cytidylate kinase
LSKKNIDASENKIKKNLINRDENDINRKISPLKKADDAIEIDTTNMTIEQQVKIIYNEIKQGKLNDNKR